MKKTDQLLLMMEHPHDYTAEEWQQILQNEECRELYMLMAKTRSALVSDGNISDEVIDAAWERLNAIPDVSSPAHSLVLHKMAASFIGLLLISGIAFAAFHFIQQRHHTDVQQTTDTVVTANTLRDTRQASLPEDSVSVQPLVFDNVTLDSIARNLAGYYQLDLEILNEQTSQLRFYFVWNQADGIEETVEKLNMFEQVSMTVEDGKLMIK